MEKSWQERISAKTTPGSLLTALGTVGSELNTQFNAIAQPVVGLLDRMEGGVLPPDLQETLTREQAAAISLVGAVGQLDLLHHGDPAVYGGITDKKSALDIAGALLKDAQEVFGEKYPELFSALREAVQEARAGQSRPL